MNRLKEVAEYHGQRSLSEPISSVIRQASSKLSGSCLVPQGQSMSSGSLQLEVQPDETGMAATFISPFS